MAAHLLKRSLTVFDDLRASANEIEYFADPTTGELRIGVTEPQAALVAAIIKRMFAGTSALPLMLALQIRIHSSIVTCASAVSIWS